MLVNLVKWVSGGAKQEWDRAPAAPQLQQDVLRGLAQVADDRPQLTRVDRAAAVAVAERKRHPNLLDLRGTAVEQ